MQESLFLPCRGESCELSHTQGCAAEAPLCAVLIDLVSPKVRRCDVRTAQTLLVKMDFGVLLSAKHLLIVDQAEVFAEAKL